MDSHVCAGCGTVITSIEKPPTLPDGLAHGKQKILQVNLQEEDGEHYAVFEYYLEYGMDCMTVLRVITPPRNGQEGSVEGPYLLPVKALAAFIDWFREELKNRSGEDRTCAS